MKLGVFSVILQDKPLDTALGLLKEQGVEMVEIGCGGVPGKAHCDPDILLKDDLALNQFKDTFKKHGLEISALSCHGNPVHPNRQIAQKDDYDMRQAVLLAEKLGIRNINGFSGCPGGSPADATPNWVTCAWPPDFEKILDYQWNDVLIPYWREFAAFALDHGVDRIGLEMHPGFSVYNTETMRRLRAAVGESLGANVDPSHLIWQGMEPVRVIKELGSAIFHFHAKDTKLDADNVRKNGVLDTKNYTLETERAWIFRTVGYGHGGSYWRDIVSALRLAGYDYVISIEHEDSLMSGPEGVTKAIEFLKPLILRQLPGQAYWA